MTKIINILSILFIGFYSLPAVAGTCDHGVNFSDGGSYKNLSALITCHQKGDAAVLDRVVTLKDGKKEGLTTLYDNKGRKYAEENFSENKRHGEARYFSPDTQTLTKIKTYNQGKLEGLQKKFFSSGQMERINYESRENKGDQSFIAYTEDGKIEDIGCASKEVSKEHLHLCNSSVTLYNDDGSKKADINFNHGKFEGLNTTYGRDGSILEQATYKQGVRDGITKEFWPNGHLKYVSTYQEGNLDGIQEEYDEETGKISKRRNIDIKTGGTLNEEKFFKNGNKSFEKNRLDDGRYEYRDYYDNGKIAADGMFERQKNCYAEYCGSYSVGAHRLYNEAGKLVRINHYNADEHFIEKSEFYDSGGNVSRIEEYYSDGSRK